VKTKAIVLVAILVGVLALAVIGYTYLSKNYQAQEDIKAEAVRETEKEPQKAVDFTVTDKAGNKVNLSDNFGKPIVVNFWATWCGPCKSEMPEFNKIYKEYGDEIIFMMVNLTDGYRDTTEKVNQFILENGYEFPVYFDTEYSAASAYSINSIPATLFINKNGEITDGHLGAMSESVLRGYIKPLLSGAGQ